MSDSILYLAIVAIWAGFLIPTWVRRPQTSRSESYAEAAEYDAEAGPGGAPEPAADEVAAETAAPDFEPDVRGDTPTPRRPAPGPSQSREQMMRARRRMLTILTSLVFITGAFVASGLVRWWICVPPVVLLVLYVLLLREIAMADAELARKRAAWESRAERDLWRRAHQAWEAEQDAASASAAAAASSASAEPTAEIIDISSRVGDQLYDQYADAAVRAVGD